MGAITVTDEQMRDGETVGVLGLVAPAVRRCVDVALLLVLVAALAASVAAIRLVWHVAAVLW